MNWTTSTPTVFSQTATLMVRPCREDEIEPFRALIAKHHYLKGDRSAGDTIRYVAELDGKWVGLLSWGAAAYKLKHRDNWIGWGSGLRKARLKLVVQNRRFCMLTERGSAPNLASQIMGACLRRLPDDWMDAFGYKPLIAETFVDPDYATSTCYKATNWQALGVTAGSGRHSRDFYQRHDKPKTLWCIELRKGARSLLSNSATLPEDVRGGVLTDAVKSTEASYSSCQSLMEVFAKLPDPRARSGQRYPQKQLLGIIALGMLSGCRDLLAIVNLGQDLSQMQLRALGGWQRKKTGLYEAPGYNAFYNLLGQVDAQGFDAALCEWLARHEGSLPSDLALDGKVLRGSADSKGHRLSLVALIENNTQRLVAQQPMRVISDSEKDKQEGELTAARRLLEQVPSLEGRTVTGDAMFTHADIMQRIVQDKGGDYVLAIKDNQPKLHTHVQQAFDAKYAGAMPPLFVNPR